jgi:hypothetical protein
VSDAPQPESRSRSNLTRTVAAGVGVIWLGALIWLVANGANPVTINRAQVAEAASRGLVISATVIDESTGRVRVEEVLAQNAGDTEPLAKGTEILIAKLSRSGSCKSGRRFVLPLGRVQNAYLVVPTNLPGQIPLIYPDTDDARQQVADVLARHQQRAAR